LGADIVLAGSVTGRVLLNCGLGPEMELLPSPRGLLEVKGFVIKPIPLYASKNDPC